MLNSAILKAFTLAAMLSGGLALTAYPARALPLSTTYQPLVAVATTKQDQPAPAQEAPNLDEIAPVSDQELTQFANALVEIQSIQDSYDAQIVSVVEGQGLSPERFDQILMVVQSPQQAQAENIPEVSEEEASSFEQVLVQVGAIQEDTRNQMRQAIQDEGLALNRFQEIILVVNNDESLESRVRQMIESAGEQS